MAAITAALIQMTSSDDPAENVAFVAARAREAAAAGADLIATPEVTVMIESRRARLFEKITRQERDPHLAALRALAAELGRHLLIGSMAVLREPETGAATPAARVEGDAEAEAEANVEAGVASGGAVGGAVGAEAGAAAPAGDDGRRAANRSILIGPDGAVLATYDKIHMFDVDVGEGERWRESATYAPGDRAVLAPIAPGGVGLKLGMTICYDVRFPALYRALAQAGADVIAVPSAFTRPTGAAHWRCLLRARAIETGAFVIAPAQTGVHNVDGAPTGRKTWGHSMIVDPWGEVVAEAGEGTGVVMARIDLDAAPAARRKIPSLRHDRSFAPPSVLG